MSRVRARNELPRSIELMVMPLLSVLLALFVAGLFVAAVGQNPFQAIALIIKGSLGSAYGFGYTLFYATSFLFTGLAVAIAFHAGLFSIGAEGQATMGGIGLTIVALYFGDLPAWLLIPFAVVMAAIFGAVWAAIPGVLQAYRGSHIVITTIMFNLISFPLLSYLLNGIWQRGQGYGSESPPFPEAVLMPQGHEIASFFGLTMARSPVNASLGIALLLAFLFWILVWRTRLGYAIRVTGLNDKAASYAGINVRVIIIIAMAISGALASGAALNFLLGDQHRLLLHFVGGAGYIGIAVALMGRNHPLGIALAALLFGVLTQGSAEIAFEMPEVSPDAIVIIQGLIILFVGAFENMLRPFLVNLVNLVSPPSEAKVEVDV